MVLLVFRGCRLDGGSSITSISMAVERKTPTAEDECCVADAAGELVKSSLWAPMVSATAELFS